MPFRSLRELSRYKNDPFKGFDKDGDGVGDYAQTCSLQTVSEKMEEIGNSLASKIDNYDSDLMKKLKK